MKHDYQSCSCGWLVRVVVAFLELELRQLTVGAFWSPCKRIEAHATVDPSCLGLH